MAHGSRCGVPARLPGTGRPANSNHWCASPAACCLPGVAIHPPYAIVRYHQQTRDPLEARLPEAPPTSARPPSASRRDNPVAHTHTHKERERERERRTPHTRTPVRRAHAAWTQLYAGPHICGGSRAGRAWSYHTHHTHTCTPVRRTRAAWSPGYAEPHIHKRLARRA